MPAQHSSTPAHLLHSFRLEIIKPGSLSIGALRQQRPTNVDLRTIPSLHSFFDMIGYAMNLRALRTATLQIAALGSALTAGLTLYLGFYQNEERWSVLPLLAGFLIWGVLPYCVLLWGAAVLTHSRVSAIVVLITTVIELIAGAVFYCDAFFIHPDAQSALVFIFIPFYQLLASTVVVCPLAIHQAASKLEGRTAK
jgi:hypothetical protein